MKFLKLITAATVSALCLATFCVSAEEVLTEKAGDVAEGAVAAEATLGSQENPYVISDKSGLENMASLTAQGQTKGVYFVLGNDIELNAPALFTYTETEVTAAKEGAVKWTPAGNETTPFEGVFDGNGHYITGLYCDNTNPCGGLFGVIDGAVVKNVNFDFALIEAKEYAGVVAGKVKGAAEISDCVVSGSVIGKQQELASVVGGIAGSVADGAKVSGCCFYGAATGSNAFSSNVGGIAGLNNGTVEKCAFGGRVYGVSMYFSSNVGGIVGSNHGEIKGCLSQGSAGAESTGEVNDCNAGGIVGYSDGYVSQCKNESAVTSYCASFSNSISTAGGIAGYVKNSDLYGCENNGKIQGLQGVFAGGIAGLSVVDNGQHKISDCLNNGEVTSDFGVAGGVCARVSASGYVTNKNELVSCANTADVNGASYGGSTGIVYSDGAEVVAQNCYYPAGYTDAFEEGSAAVANAGYTSGTALTGLTNTAVWKFESGKKPYIVYADGLAKKTSTITAEASQSIILPGSNIQAQGVGNIVLSKPLTAGIYDVIVRFTGNDETFAPKSVVVNVNVVVIPEKFALTGVDTSALTVADGVISGKVKVSMEAPEAGKEYNVITNVFVNGVFASTNFTPVTTQQAQFDGEYDITPVSVADGDVVVINVMVVDNAENVAPVCEDITVEA